MALSIQDTPQDDLSIRKSVGTLVTLHKWSEVVKDFTPEHGGIIRGKTLRGRRFGLCRNPFQIGDLSGFSSQIWPGFLLNRVPAVSPWQCQPVSQGEVRLGAE